MSEMLKLKGQTESGEWVEFCLCPASIYDIRQDKVLIFDNDNPATLHRIDPATIQPADNPRKHLMFTITCPNCDYEYMDPFEDGSFECPECELYLPPKKDPRKVLLEELKSKLENAYLDRISTTQEDIGGNTWMMFGDILHVNEDVIGEMEDKL